MTLQPLNNSALGAATTATFDFARVLTGRASSRHTQRAYARWVDRFLVDVAGLEATTGQARTERMHALPVSAIIPVLNVSGLRAWLGKLSEEGHGKQGLNQARASIVTLALLLAEAGWLDDYTSVSLGNVRTPRAEDGQRPGHWLSVEQIRLLMLAAEKIASSENQRARNKVVISMLCTMALRREELSEARWSDLTTQNGRPVMLIHGKGSKAVYVDVPKTVMQAIDLWSIYVSPTPESALVRRVWKGGVIDPKGLTTDALWRIVNGAAKYANLGNVAPHDLRRSIAGSLQLSGVSVDKISQLLRHSNVAITERYLSKLPQQNEGAVLMADLLGLD
ncbi:MAG TPA: site-specific integrase [Aggregatilineaceae bacterium]|nr:site-specific integrase [Aggregatilineaceae bacterium]